MGLPFKAGLLAEARTWEEGYRGAWFRCKIAKICRRKGKLGHYLEYVDFPEEKLEWSMLYQNPEGIKNVSGELMLRPPYPPRKTEKQLLHVSEISEVTVIDCDSWRVGDLVDWWTSDCYWSGRITELLSDKEAKIQLNLPPLGEGLSYTALLKDLRPSLDWSPKHGWTVPTQDGGRRCARLVKPINQAVAAIETSKEIESGPKSDGSFVSSAVSSNSAIEAKSGTAATKKTSTCSTLKTVSKKRKNEQEKELDNSSTSKKSRVVADSGQIEAEPIAEDELNSEGGQKKTSISSLLKRVSEKQKRKQEKKLVDSSTSKPSRVVADSGQIGAEIAEDKLNSDCGQKKNTACERHVLNSKCSDTLEAAILDLEEYVNKVKWLKRIMQYGISSSDAQGSQWEYVG